MLETNHFRRFGTTDLLVPPIIFGTRAFGDDARPIHESTKIAICGEWFQHVAAPVVVETSPRYGEGLALESLVKAFDRLEVASDEVIVFNQLGSKPAERTPRRFAMSEAADASLEWPFNYQGTFDQWEESCRLLGGRHTPRLVTLRGADEFLGTASSATDRDERLAGIHEAIRALKDLKEGGRVRAIGISTRDWRFLQEIGDQTPFDCILLAGNLTVMRHPPELLAFIEQLAARGVAIIVAGVLHDGFLSGGATFDGRVLDATRDTDRSLLAWRKTFVSLCQAHGVSPLGACVRFSLASAGATSVLLNTSHPDRIREQVDAVRTEISPGFWASMKEEGLLAEDYPHVG